VPVILLPKLTSTCLFPELFDGVISFGEDFAHVIGGYQSVGQFAIEQ